MAIPRLIYGFLSKSTDPFNISVPWRISDQDGMFQMNYSFEKSVEDNLRVWAKTNWGERPMRFRFGLDAKRAIFEPEVLTKERLRNNAVEQLRKYFGFIKIKKLEILTREDDPDVPENTVRFILEGTVKDNEDRQIKISEDVGF